VWGKVTMISCGVEISVAGGGGEMVRVLSLGPNQAPFIGISLQPLPWLLITSRYISILL